MSEMCIFLWEKCARKYTIWDFISEILTKDYSIELQRRLKINEDILITLYWAFNPNVY